MTTYDLCLSTGNSKLGRIPNISMPPILSCRRHLLPCRELCYAAKFMGRTAVRQGWLHNYWLWQTHPARFMEALKRYLLQKRPARFRYFVGGDIPDMDFWDFVISLGYMFPKTAFLCFTKRYELVATSPNPVPENLSVYISRWPECEALESVYASLKRSLAQYPCAIMQGKEAPRRRWPGARPCPGSCATCTLCFKGKMSVVFEQH